MSKCNCENTRCGEEHGLFSPCQNQGTLRAHYVGLICEGCASHMPNGAMIDKRKSAGPEARASMLRTLGILVGRWEYEAGATEEDIKAVIDDFCKSREGT